jgi:hypothetical protein
MAFIQDALKVAGIAALKALASSTTPKRVDGAFYAVDDNGDGVPAWYLYSASVTTSEDLPSIVSPTDGIGRFIQFGGSGGGDVILTVLKVAGIAALKALASSTTPKRVDGAFYAVDNNGDGVPAWYLYSASATTSENLPSIVSPTDGIGRFIQFGGSGGGNVILTVSTTSPITSPPSVTPITGGKVCKHLEITDSYGTFIFTEWTGVDSTGVLGNNGWVYVNLI